MHRHEYVTFPAADIGDELPLYCIVCLDKKELSNSGGLLFASGRTMSFDEWNDYFNDDGSLVDPNNDPARFNKVNDAL